MKLRHLFLAAIVALGMMACNNEDAPQVDGAESTVSVMVVPSSKGLSTKAVGDLINDGISTPGLAVESEIKSLEVYLFAGETPDGYKKETSTTSVTQVLEIETHSGPKTLVVVANANIGPVANLTALKAKTAELPVNIGNGLPMTAEPISINLEAGDNQYGFASGVANYDSNAKQHSSTPLPLVRVNARVAIVDAKVDADLANDNDAIMDGLTNVEVAIFNVAKETNLFGAPLATNSNYLFGESWPSTQGSYTIGITEGSFKDVVNATSGFPITVSKSVYYYVTENTSSKVKEQMLIVLRGKPVKGSSAVHAEGLYTDENGFTYYPVWVNATKSGYTYNGDDTGDSIIRRNTQYNIKLLIKGIGNPTIDDVEKAFLDVNISVEPWKVVTQDVTWE